MITKDLVQLKSYLNYIICVLQIILMLPDFYMLFLRFSFWKTPLFFLLFLLIYPFSFIDFVLLAFKVLFYFISSIFAYRFSAYVVRTCMTVIQSLCSNLQYSTTGNKSFDTSIINRQKLKLYAKVLQKHELW